MDLINEKVEHKVLGIGTVIEFDKERITVQFENKMSRFVYPDAFVNFLKALNPITHEAIMNEIILKQAEEEKRQAELETLVKKEISQRTVPSSIKNIEDGFGQDYNVQYLARDRILTYQEVEEQFNIKITGFGRGINKTPSSVVLISSIDKKKSGFVYHDRWTTDGDYIYSGEGKIGDQSLTSGNKAIIDAATEGKEIHLFVKFSPQEYYYQGVFRLVDYTYEDDKDEMGNTRKEYKFRLRRIN